MRALIGNSLISKLAPKDKQYDVRDTKLPGFLIRVNPTGNMFYVCQYNRGRRMNLGRVGVISAAVARDKALAILGDVARGIEPQDLSKNNTNLNLKDFMSQHYTPWVIEHRKVGSKTVAHITRCFVKSFGDKSLIDFNPALLDHWRTQRLKSGCSIETVNRDIATLKAAISKAVLWGLIDKHPLEKFKLLKSDKSGKIRYLSIDEEQRLRNSALERENNIKLERNNANQWRLERNYPLLDDLVNCAFADYLRPMILLSINTGVRRGELFSLKWENVNFDYATITIEGSYAKSGKTRHIPLNSEAFEVLKNWRKQTISRDLVFHNKDGNRFDTIKKSWQKVLDLAKISNFRWHDLRHHFASRLVMAGVDLNTVRELLGHAEMTMTLRYAHLAPEHKANAVEKIVQNNKYS